MTVLFPALLPEAAKSTLKTTLSLTRKTGSKLKSTLALTIKFLQRRKNESRTRQSWVPVFAQPPISDPNAAPTQPIRSFAPITAGSQIIRLASSAAELDAAQALRYRVFYEEMGAHPSAEMLAAKRDFDQYDAVCDHLIVVDQSRESGSQVVGTYRVMRREHVRAVGGFYSASEYDVSRLASFPGTVMELGRSCVDAGYRDRATMQLLWRGIAEYLNAHDVDLMFGCASLHGTDPEKIAVQLSYLYHYHLAPEVLRAKALPERFVNMNILPKDSIDPRRALASLPPLLKGYLRVGGFIGDGAVVDHQFNTTDVCIIVKTDLIADRYTRHYDLGERKAASFKQAS
jgi:putative hemolysin